MSKKKNFAIWDNSKKLERLEVAFLFVAWCFLGWLMTNAPSEEVSKTAGIFFALATIAGVAYAGKQGIALQTVGFGKSDNKLVLSLIAGIVLAFLLTSSGFFVFNPTAFAITSTTILGISSTLIFVGFIAPIIEEEFFRSTLMPTISEWFNNPWYGLFGQAGAFGAWHFLVSGGNVNIMLASVVFGLIVGYANTYFQSTGFGYAAHLVNNLRAIGVI